MGKNGGKEGEEAPADGGQAATRRISGAANYREISSAASDSVNASETKSEGNNVNSKRLSKLQRWILTKAGDGIERGAIIEKFFKIERRYKGFYTDPCMRPRELRIFERKFNAANASLTRALKPLESRGLVGLIRKRKYVKKAKVTDEGKKAIEAHDGVKKKEDHELEAAGDRICEVEVTGTKDA